METEPLANGAKGAADTRDALGRFLPGCSGGPGNPFARNVGAWRAALANAVTPEDIRDVALKLLQSAKAGEAWAVHELLDRCLGKPDQKLAVEAQVTIDDLIAIWDTV